MVLMFSLTSFFNILQLLINLFGTNWYTLIILNNKNDLSAIVHPTTTKKYLLYFDLPVNLGIIMTLLTVLYCPISLGFY